MALLLDKRQRAMLEEMGIKVWLPERDAQGGEVGEVVAAAPPCASAPAASSTPIADRSGQGPEPSAPFQAQARALGIDSMDWATLQSTVTACRACGLCQRRKNAVFGVGPQRADWLVVGEAPGQEEDLAGEPFVGASGRLLDNMLRAIGLSREASTDAGGPQSKVYITNLLKCRPPNNRNPEPHEAAQCAPYLRRQIELLQPTIILAVGRFATNELLRGVVPDIEQVPLGKLRGRPYRYQTSSMTTPVVVTYHPAYLLRNLAAKAQAWEDLCLALEVSRRPRAGSDS